MKKNRICSLQAKIIEHDIDCLLTNYPDNIRYLCGFTGSAGWLLVSMNQAYLAVDFRYAQQARNETRNTNIQIVDIRSEFETWLSQIILDNQMKIVGFESDNLVYSLYNRLIELFKTKSNKITLLPCNNVIESLRAIKDTEEINNIQTAATLLDETFDFILSFIKPGITECQLAWIIEKYLKEHGSENSPFDIIVASGTNSAMPHAKATDKTIALNEPILMDFGARVRGYCSDFSRTILLGKIDDNFKKVYDIVLSAQLTALTMINKDITGNIADSYARVVIEKANFKDQFGHGLGHGIGLSIHEYPRLGPSSNDILSSNMVFTIEPGIYIQGWGGVRIEDTVILKNDKVISFNKANKLIHIS